MPARGKVGEEVSLKNVKRGEQMTFVSLHHHSTYSFLDGYGHPSEHVKRAAELGMTALALTEHGNVSSHPKLEQAAREVGVKPIFGCELYTGEAKTQRKNHLSVWAQDQEGYRNLLRMLSWAWKPEDEGGGFYYEPTVSGSTFARYQEGLVVASGCLGGLLATSLIGGKNIEASDASFERGLRVARRFRELLGDRYYLEVQAFPQLDSTRKLNPLLEQIAKRLQLELVATADVHYCHPDHSKLQTILHAVRPGKRMTYEDQARAWGYDVKLCHPQSDNEILLKLIKTGLTKKAARRAIENTQAIADVCTVELPKAAPLQFPLPAEYSSSKDLFYDLLREGWNYRGISQKEDRDRYAARLEHEAKLIESKDFIDYFLIVSDMTKWAKDHGIFVGPARGSAAASLVCYLLRITEVDPMLFPDLLFERFIDETRKDLPDIDLDFDDRRRPEVFEYLEKEYGPDYVGHLGTFTTYKAKLALDDVGRVFKVPPAEVDQVKELLLTRSSGDARASATIEDTAAMFPAANEVFEKHPDLWNSTRLEGMVKGMSRHAAGAIVSATPIAETTAVYGETLAVDKHDAEYLNLLKIDVLGLNTMGFFSECAELLGMTYEDFTRIPLDDPETLRGFQEKDLTGIFQFDGRAMRLVNNQLIPDSFYEVSAVNALARPGPLHSGSTAQYIDVKKGVAKFESLHPLFDEIVANTQHQVVFQEQILRIVTDVSNFDWTDKAYIRKIISKKIGEQEMNKQWKKFYDGAKQNGVDKETARRIWDLCVTAGAYAFNAAHSVSYGMIAWWSMWVKRHHPEVFFVAALRRLAEDKQLQLLRDASRHGVKVLAPHPRFSALTWELTPKRNIRAGFVQIPGIGEKTAQAIIEFREERGLRRWEDLLDVKGIGPKTIQTILEFVHQDDPLGVHVLDRTLAKAVRDIRAGKFKDSTGSLLPIPTHRVSDLPIEKGEDLQVVWIGVITHRNLRDLFEYHFSKTGEVLDASSVQDPHLREWVLLYGIDGDESVTLNINRWRYDRFREAVWNIKLGKDLVLIRGVKKGSQPQKTVHVSDMWVLGD